MDSEYTPRSALAAREFALILALVLLFMAGAGVAWWISQSQRSPEAAVRRFLEADIKGQSSREYMHTTSPAVPILFEFYDWVRGQSAASPFAGYRILGGRMDGQRADITVHLQSPWQAGQATTVNIPLIRVNGTWLIDGDGALENLLRGFAVMGAAPYLKQVPSLLMRALPSQYSSLLSAYVTQTNTPASPARP